MLAGRACGCDGGEPSVRVGGICCGSEEVAGGGLLSDVGGWTDRGAEDGDSGPGGEANVRWLVRGGVSATGSGRALRESNDIELEWF